MVLIGGEKYKMKKVLGLFSPLVLGFALRGEVIPPGPSGLLQIGDTSTAFTLYETANEKVTRLNVNIAGTNWSLTGDATVNPDPFIQYGFSFQNLGATDLSFLVLLSTPYVGGPYSVAKSSHSGSVTDGNGLLPANGAVTVTPGVGGVHQPSVDGTPFGAITGGCSVSAAPEDSFPCGLGNINGISIATLTNGTLSVLLQATVSPGDIYTFNGLASITNIPGDEVPEPATAGLAFAALGAVIVARKRMAA